MKFLNISVIKDFKLEIDKGWKSLILKCLEELDSLNIRIHLIRICGHNGGLYLYYDLNRNDIKKISDLIFDYIKISYQTCEKCGSTENVSTKTKENEIKGLIKTYCEKCYSKEKSSG